MEPPLDIRRLSLPALAGILAVLISVSGPVARFQAAAWPLEHETEEASPPQMAFSSVTWDAGPVERGEMITHEFTFRNSGGSDLMILSTKAG